MTDFFKALLEVPVTTIFIVCGIIFFGLAFLRKIDKMEVDRQPNLWALTIGALLLLVGIILFYSSPSSEIQNFPFEATVYDFENPTNETDITPWSAVPESKSYKTIISRDYAHSGKHSLHLSVDMQSAATNPDIEYAGIGLKEDIPLSTKALVAWIFIPQSEPIQNVIFKAHILTYVKNDGGTSNVIRGEDTRIVPGTWVPLFIGTFGVADFTSDHIIWNGKIDELYLTIWSNEPYHGSIYIDDFSIYQ